MRNPAFRRQRAADEVILDEPSLQLVSDGELATGFEEVIRDAADEWSATLKLRSHREISIDGLPVIRQVRPPIVRSSSVDPHGLTVFVEYIGLS